MWLMNLMLSKSMAASQARARREANRLTKEALAALDVGNAPQFLIKPSDTLSEKTLLNLQMQHGELLAACERMAEWIEQHGEPYLKDTDDNPGQAIRVAIAKAKGAQS